MAMWMMDSTFSYILESVMRISREKSISAIIFPRYDRRLWSCWLGFLLVVEETKRHGRWKSSSDSQMIRSGNFLELLGEAMLDIAGSAECMCDEKTLHWSEISRSSRQVWSSNLSPKSQIKDIPIDPYLKSTSKSINTPCLSSRDSTPLCHINECSSRWRKQKSQELSLTLWHALHTFVRSPTMRHYQQDQLEPRLLNSLSSWESQAKSRKTHVHTCSRKFSYFGTWIHLKRILFPDSSPEQSIMVMSCSDVKCWAASTKPSDILNNDILMIFVVDYEILNFKSTNQNMCWRSGK
jgi:hypothetical protein